MLSNVMEQNTTVFNAIVCCILCALDPYIFLRGEWGSGEGCTVHWKEEWFSTGTILCGVFGYTSQYSCEMVRMCEFVITFNPHSQPVTLSVRMLSICTNCPQEKGAHTLMYIAGRRLRTEPAKCCVHITCILAYNTLWVYCIISIAERAQHVNPMLYLQATPHATSTVCPVSFHSSS